jgi:3-hydroxymyristoyl/3-hydroxydecanoyl-(acyl carrier protein) dehydratase
MKADDVLQTLPHQPPFRLVDRLRSNQGGVAIAERRVTSNDPLVGGVLPATLIVEALAQTAALIAGAEIGRHHGMLVALKNVRVDGAARVGDTLELVARRTGTLGALHRVSGEARVEGGLVLCGELTFAIEPATS